MRFKFIFTTLLESQWKKESTKSVCVCIFNSYLQIFFFFSFSQIKTAPSDQLVGSKRSDGLLILRVHLHA